MASCLHWAAMASLRADRLDWCHTDTHLIMASSGQYDSRAQVHLRHLVGGRARSYTGELPNERIFQVRAEAFQWCRVLKTLPTRARCSLDEMPGQACLCRG